MLRKVLKKELNFPVIHCLFALFHALVEMLTLFSCMCMMASDTLTEMESVASSMLNGPSSFSDTWYRASEREGGGDTERQMSGRGMFLVTTSCHKLRIKAKRGPLKTPVKINPVVPVHEISQLPIRRLAL